MASSQETTTVAAVLQSQQTSSSPLPRTHSLEATPPSTTTTPPTPQSPQPLSNSTPSIATSSVLLSPLKVEQEEKNKLLRLKKQAFFLSEEQWEGSDKILKEGALQLTVAAAGGGAIPPSSPKKTDAYFYLFHRFLLKTNNEPLSSASINYRSLIPFSSYLDQTAQKEKEKNNECLVIPLETCWITTSLPPTVSPSQKNEGGKEKEFWVMTPEKTFLLEASDANQKVEWIQKIESQLLLLLSSTPSDLKTGRRNGRYVYSDGSTYQGSWLNAKRDGKGRLEIVNRKMGQGNQTTVAVYEGEFRDNEIHGDGKMIFLKTQALLDGRWEIDVKGSGLIIYLNGSNCVGKWRVFLPSSSLSSSSQSNSTGSSSSIQVIEFGKVFFLDGKKYTGFLQNNIIEGYGIMSYPDGSNYVGSWKSSLRDGYGMISGGITKRENTQTTDNNENSNSLKTQERFLGRWEKGDINGEGVFEYSSTSPTIFGLFKG
eukprot:TRINITY_DN2725_c0_g1_i2.p1 TRINITY_DN2725_c0_g1~~TRINITY_DN2725_c0_g1_i2.p1  ORF type:complete len:484 (+),score=152.39 TRINITY_DN2725_c0_g1_i2:168-1619(+)